MAGAHGAEEKAVRDTLPAEYFCNILRMYADFCSEFIIDPDTLADNDNDDPLGASAGEDGSKYSDYFKHKELMLEIDKDTKRTWTSMHFFAESTLPSKPFAGGPSSQQVRAALICFTTDDRFNFFLLWGAGLASAVHRSCAVRIREAEPRHPLRAGHERAAGSYVRRSRCRPPFSCLTRRPAIMYSQHAKIPIIARVRAVYSRESTAKQTRSGASAT
jgi:hypothetical protein